MITLAMWTLNVFQLIINLRVDDHLSLAFSESDVREDHENPTHQLEKEV